MKKKLFTLSINANNNKRKKKFYLCRIKSAVDKKQRR